ncbi:hypothetical protein ACFLQJ_03205, partial [Calditrichota bacterium]
MNSQAIAPLISALFLFSLGTVSILSGRKEKLWRTFSAFCFLSMLVAWLSFLIASGISARASANLSRVFGLELNMMQIHVRLMPIFGFLSVMFAIYYAVQLTGVA